MMPIQDAVKMLELIMNTPGAIPKGVTFETASVTVR